MKKIEWYRQKIAQLEAGYQEELDRIAQLPLETKEQIETYELERIVFNQRSRSLAKMRRLVERLGTQGNGSVP